MYWLYNRVDILHQLFDSGDFLVEKTVLCSNAFLIVLLRLVEVGTFFITFANDF